MTWQFPFISIDWDYIPRRLVFNLWAANTSLRFLTENKKQNSILAKHPQAENCHYSSGGTGISKENYI